MSTIGYSKTEVLRLLALKNSGTQIFNTVDTYVVDGVNYKYDVTNNILTPISSDQAAIGLSNHNRSHGLLGQLGSTNRWVIVIAGQSNGEGNGIMPANAPVSIPGCMMLAKDNVFRNLTEPSHNRYAGAVDNWTPSAGNPNNARYSLATDLSNWLKRLTGADVLILPCAVGSTFINTWLQNAYDDPPVLTTMFGQMRDRVNLACQGDFSRLIILHHGHEGEVGGTTASRALNYHNLIAAYRYWFGNVPIIFPQLASHTDSNTALSMAGGADTQWRLDQDYGDNSTNTGAYTTSALKTINNGVAAASPDWSPAQNNATNTITDTPGGVQFTGDGSQGLAYVLSTLVVGRTYRIRFTIAATTGQWKLSTNNINPASGWKLNGVDQALAAINLGSGQYEFVVTYAAGNFQIQRQQSGVATIMKITAMTIEEAVVPKHPYVYTYPTWDVAMNGSTDAYHIATAGQKENGRRAALVIANRIMGLPNLRVIDGSGNNVPHVGHPHLTSARNVSGSTTVVSCFFNQVLANKGADNLWLVEVAGVAQTISSVVINADATRVDITLSAPITAGSATVSYAAMQENSDGSAFTNFLRNAEGLPPVRFYRYPVAAA